MKRAISLVAAFLLLASLLCAFPVNAAGSLSASASTTSVTVGQSVTITLKYNGGGKPIGGFIGYLKYDAAVFSYTSFTGDGVDASGGAGTVKFLYSAPGGTAPTEVSLSLTLQALAVGDGKISVETDEFINDEDYTSLGTPSKTLSVSAINPTKSGNADLASLKPSKGTLTPKFSANTTEYTVTVPYTVTSLTLSATTAHADAKTAISGKNALDVGKNTRVVTVTAPNGTTKKYTVVITRSADQSTTTNQGGSTTTTTAPPPANDALEVEVGGKLMWMPEVQPTVDLPAGYRWDTVSINGLDLPAAKHESNGIVLLYLTEKEENAGAFFIYNAVANTFSTFRPYAVPGGVFALHDLPNSETGPDGTVPGTLDYEGGSVSAFVYEDAAQADFYIVYATSPAGVTGLYVYDRTDGSLQRYREIQPPVNDTPPDDTPEPTGGFVAFLTNNRTVILLISAICGGLALLAGAVVLLIVILRRPRNFKH